MDTVATPRRNQDAAARAERAAELRVAGATWSAIAEQCGYSAGTHAARAVRTYFADAPEVDRAASRELWRQRVEWLWTEAVADVQARRPGALRAAVALAQRASSLDGLDAPSVVEVYTPSETEFQAVLARMVAFDHQSRGLPMAAEGDPFAESEDFIEVDVIEVEEPEDEGHASS